jgi:hypothetical protein
MVRARLDAVPAQDASLRDDLDVVFFELDRLYGAMLNAVEAASTPTGFDIDIMRALWLVVHRMGRFESWYL